jgi:hypothetical protein
MEHKGYKLIPTEYGFDIAIPDNLPPDQEAALIAKRMAELDPVVIEADRKEIAELMAHPENAVPFEDIIRELELMDQSSSQDPA